MSAGIKQRQNSLRWTLAIDGCSAEAVFVNGPRREVINEAMGISVKRKAKATLVREKSFRGPLWSYSFQ
ncbi:MAG: hypothetical protein VYC39_10010 [Myxococcota bacterium]|nr:hypothetical protein [Myxococcota bacterium]